MGNRTNFVFLLVRFINKFYICVPGITNDLIKKTM